ncbi:MAG: tetratricopeptide repeat protein [Blastocatellia bacterium]
MSKHRTVKLALLLITLSVGIGLVASEAATTKDKDRAQLTGRFDPSNAKTENGDFIPVEQFISASRCVGCHQDTHNAWSESLHRNAAREPFYRESADILLKTRGIEFTRHCESCHTPVALFSGALVSTATGRDRVAPFTPLDDEGVTCTVCHSITEARLDGTGSYTIRRPALLAREDGTPVYGDFSDEQILADVPAHKRAVIRPLLKSPEFCATCHKVDAPTSLNGYKNIRGFSAYDEWQQSGASHESVTPFYQRNERADCRSCHMPKVESANDRSSKQGKIASHRWLGANTAAPLFYGQTKQVELTEKFLQADVLDVDIFAIKREVTGELIAPLTPVSENCFAPLPNEEVTAEVVISNRNAAHSFPPEVRDLYEAWVEFEAIDATGKTIYRSGFIKPDGLLDETAHVYKQIIVDEQARPITRHQIWLTNIKAYDNAILPGRSDVARFRFRMPDGQQAVTLRARVNYRRFNQEYTNYVLTRQKRQMAVPVVRMAEAVVTVAAHDHQLIPAKHSPIYSSQPANPLWKRWNDYGIGLLEQAQHSQAVEAFRYAAMLNPADSNLPNLLVNQAIAEMRTEKFSHVREQWRRADSLLDSAMLLDPMNWRGRFFKSLVLRGDGKLADAANEFSQIAKQYPRDREVIRNLGQSLYAIGRVTEAREKFESLIAIDPTDSGAWQFLSSIYASEGRKAEAERAQSLYLKWRDDPRAYDIALRFFAAHPQWGDERVSAHTHGEYSAKRSIVTGAQAAPDR